nr:hypothetical protein HK105_003858 [Polyrhizophydium stewartii]
MSSRNSPLGDLASNSAAGSSPRSLSLARRANFYVDPADAISSCTPSPEPPKQIRFSNKVQQRLIIDDDEGDAGDDEDEGDDTEPFEADPRVPESRMPYPLGSTSAGAGAGFRSSAEALCYPHDEEGDEDDFDPRHFVDASDSFSASASSSSVLLAPGASPWPGDASPPLSPLLLVRESDIVRNMNKNAEFETDPNPELSDPPSWCSSEAIAARSFTELEYLLSIGPVPPNASKLLREHAAFCPMPPVSFSTVSLPPTHLNDETPGPIGRRPADKDVPVIPTAQVPLSQEELDRKHPPMLSAGFLKPAPEEPMYGMIDFVADTIANTVDVLHFTWAVYRWTHWF